MSAFTARLRGRLASWATVALALGVAGLVSRLPDGTLRTLSFVAVAGVWLLVEVAQGKKRAEKRHADACDPIHDGR